MNGNAGIGVTEDPIAIQTAQPMSEAVEQFWYCGNPANAPGCECEALYHPSGGGVNTGTFCFDRGPVGSITITGLSPGNIYTCEVRA